MGIDILEKTNKIPIVLGITGHRNIVKDDYSDISAQLRQSFEEILALCNKPKTAKKNAQEQNPTNGAAKEKPPVILLTGLAQGADMLTAKIAREYEISYIAVLPCPLEKFKTSFDDAE